jgi:hypothetical protein
MDKASLNVEEVTGLLKQNGALEVKQVEVMAGVK